MIFKSLILTLSLLSFYSCNPGELATPSTPEEQAEEEKDEDEDEDDNEEPNGLFMYDSFETGDLSATNTDNFQWSGTNATSVVTTTSQSGDVNNSALNFSYPAGSFWSEQRFDMGLARRELWIRFWIKIPTNFQHNSSSPSNNKLAAIWMDDYSSHGDGPSVIWEFWHDGSGGSELAVHFSTGGYTIAGSHLQHFPFISYPADQGRWMQIVFYVKAATTRDSNDGIIRSYRRWPGENSFTQMHNIEDADMGSPVGGPDGWKAGYFMGWSNPSYTLNTNWIMDDIEFSTTSLL